MLFGLSVLLSSSLLEGLLIEQGLQAESVPQKNRRSYATETTEVCPGWVGDLGVHDNADSCTTDFHRIQTQEVPMPSVPPGAALVHVQWASANPCNWKKVETDPTGFVPGGDFAGIVTKVVGKDGENCDFAPGDRVWGMHGGGSYQEFIVVACVGEGTVAKVPPGMSMQQAGILGVTGTTAYGSFVVGYKQGPWTSAPTVLVIGGSSGTGHIGIQLAKAWGAGKVVTTASAKNADFVRQMGADEVIDYHSSNWWEVLGRGSVDLIYDCVCLPGTGDHAYEVLGDNGAFITIQTQSEASQHVIDSRPSVRHLHHNGLPSSRPELDDLSDLVVHGRLNSTVDAVFALDEVKQAFKLALEGHTVGKIAIHVS